MEHKKIMQKISLEDLMIATKDDDISGFSDSEEELEYYDPTPYAFILKDIHRNPLTIPPEQLRNAKINCPSFHILLDHVVAVLWCFYSKTGHHKLGTTQLHWAIKFLEGLRNGQNRYTPDVFMTIEDLEDALVEIAASINEQRVFNRKYDSRRLVKSSWDLTMQIGTKSSSDVFETSFLGSSTRAEIENGDNADEYSRRTSHSLLRVESPSIIINDMLGDEQEVIAELLNETMNDDMNESRKAELHCKKSIPVKDSETSFTENYEALRDELLDRTRKQLEQIKNIDDTLNRFKSQNDPERMSQLKKTHLSTGENKSKN